MCKSIKNYSQKRLHPNGMCNKAFMTKNWNQTELHLGMDIDMLYFQHTYLL